jgi:hypothetical protein
MEKKSSNIVSNCHSAMFVSVIHITLLGEVGFKVQFYFVIN